MKNMTIGFTLFISLFFIIGFGILGSGIHSLWRGRSAAKWPVTDGALTDCRWVEDSGSEDTTYRVTVKYSYQVTGRPYEGSRIAFGYSGSSSSEMHKQLYQKLKSSQKVQVHYNPLKPEDAVLAYGMSRSTLLCIVFGLTWLLFITGFTALWVLSAKDDGSLVGRLGVD